MEVGAAPLSIDASKPLQNVKEQAWSPYENNGG
jgi:hypothetical protein